MGNSYNLGLYEKSMPNSLSLKEKLRLTKEYGFDYLELSIDETDDKLKRLEMTKEERKDLVLAMYECDVHINSICLSGHRKYPLGSNDEAIEKRSLEIMQKAIDLASDLGVRIIQLAGYDVYYEKGDENTKARFIKNLKIASEMAAKKGVVLGFETMETAFMDTVEKAMYYCDIIDSPYLGIYPDIGNLTNAAKLYGHEVVDDINKGKGKIFAGHLKETIVGHYREIPFGTGHTEFLKDISALKALGVRMFVGEFWYVGQENWQEDIKYASKFLRNYLDEAFKA